MNIVGTVNVFDAANRRAGIAGRVRELGGGVLDRDEPAAAVANDATAHPATFYGVHKQACEGMRGSSGTRTGAGVGIRPLRRVRRRA